MNKIIYAAIFSLLISSCTKDTEKEIVKKPHLPIHFEFLYKGETIKSISFSENVAIVQTNRITTPNPDGSSSYIDSGSDTYSSENFTPLYSFVVSIITSQPELISFRKNCDEKNMLNHIEINNKEKHIIEATMTCYSDKNSKNTMKKSIELTEIQFQEFISTSQQAIEEIQRMKKTKHEGY